jgi:predicted SprT family Zn-dependent metalloprotease
MKITQSVIERMILRSKRHFVKSSFFDSETLKIVKDLRIFWIFNKKLKTTAGQANSLSYNEAVKILKVDKRYKRYLVDSCKRYLVIEINKRLAQRQKKETVYDTVSHEVAHCIDFVLRGHMYINGRARRGFHDKFWKNIHKATGGDGKATF